MHIVKIHEAKTHLSRLIQEVLDGEEVVIAKGNHPLVKIIQFENSEQIRKLGTAKGKVRIAPDFDAPLAEMKDYEN